MNPPLDLSGFRLEHAAQALDERAVSRACRTTLFVGCGAFTMRPTYLRLKPGTSLLVLWEATFADRNGPGRELVQATVGAGTLVADERRKWQTLHPSVTARERWLAFLPESDLVLARFPFDLELRRLPHLLDPEKVKRVVETIADPFGDGLTDAIRARGSQAELLSYKPRRRAVVRWTLRASDGRSSSERRAIAREFATAPLAGLEWRRDLATGPWPRLRSASADSTLLIEEELPGAPLAPDAPLDLAAAGELIARFHAATGAVSDRFRRPAIGWEGLRAAAVLVVADIAALAPPLAGAARALEQALPLQIADASPIVGVHGDFHAGQLLRDRDGALRLCDLDRATLAPAALDYGRLAADLLASPAFCTTDPDRIVRPLLEGALRAGAPRMDAATLKPWLALSLLQSASEPLRRCRADAEAACQRQLDLAQRLLARDVSMELSR